uniref:Retinol dehydrogenase 20 n=1 Tax=Amphilophus citrinellus TaxID=61819 RepID=A0A3Q0SJC2_AMPCI
MKVNCHSLFSTVKAFLPQMKAQKHGHIVTIASDLSLFSTACVENYCASKFAEVGFHESLAHELHAEEAEGVKITLVCPYVVNTGMFDGCKIRYAKIIIIQLRSKNVWRVKQSSEFLALFTDLSLYTLCSFLRLLPLESNVTAYHFIGSDKCMYPFIETMKNQITNSSVAVA